MKQIEVGINVDDKRDLTLWFRHQQDVDVFLGLIEQLWEAEFQAGQKLTDREMRELIELL